MSLPPPNQVLSVPAGWAAGAAALAGVAESAMSTSAANSAANTQNAINAPTIQANNSMLSMAEGVANQPYTPYTGAYAAPLSANQQYGVDQAATVAQQGQAQGLVGQGVNQINSVANNAWSPQTAAKYMNPYTSSVVSNEIENANQSYLQSLGQMKEGQAQSGAFGGSGTATGEAELAGQNQLNIGNLTATGYSNAYNEAVNAWQADNSRAESAASAYNAAGQDLTSMNNEQIQDLMATGGAAQAVAQTNLSGEYNEFMRQQGWSANQLNSLISAVKGGGGSMTYAAPYQNQTANSLMGLASVATGLYNGGLGSGSYGGSLSQNSLSSGISSTLPSLNAQSSSMIGDASVGADSDILAAMGG